MIPRLFTIRAMNLLKVLCALCLWITGLIGLGHASNEYEPTPLFPELKWAYQTPPFKNSIANYNDFQYECVAETPDGEIWFGTNKGVLKYDGFELELLNQGLTEKVNKICFQDQQAFAGTDLGLYKFETGLQSWTQIFPPKGALRELPWHIKSVIHASDNNIWAGSAWGIIRWEKGIITLFTSKENLHFLQRKDPTLNNKISSEIIPASAIPHHSWPLNGDDKGFGVQIVDGVVSPNNPNIGHAVIVCIDSTLTLPLRVGD